LLYVAEPYSSLRIRVSKEFLSLLELDEELELLARSKFVN